MVLAGVHVVVVVVVVHNVVGTLVKHMLTMFKVPNVFNIITFLNQTDKPNQQTNHTNQTNHTHQTHQTKPTQPHNMALTNAPATLIGNNLMLCRNRFGILDDTVNNNNQDSVIQMHAWLDKFACQHADVVQAGWFGTTMTRICMVDDEKLHILTHFSSSTDSTNSTRSTNQTNQTRPDEISNSGIVDSIVADNVYVACWVSCDLVCCLTNDAVLLMLPVAIPNEPHEPTDMLDMSVRPAWPSFDVDDDTEDVCCALGRAVAYLHQTPNVERIDFRSSTRQRYFMSAFDDLACTLRHLVVLAATRILVCDLDVPDVHYVGVQLEVPDRCSLSRRGDVFQSTKHVEWQCWTNTIVHHGWQVDLSVMH